MKSKKIGLTLMMVASICFMLLGQSHFSEAKAGQSHQSVYLSDMKWKNTVVSDGKTPEKDAAANGQALTLTDNNGDAVEFAKGIGTYADSEIVYKKPNQKHKFLTTWVGVDKVAAGADASVKFEIYVDGKLGYESKWMTSSTPMEFAKVDIKKAKTIKLVTKGDGGYANWAETQLHKKDPVESNDHKIKQYQGMKLVFHDEFNGKKLDSKKWGFATTPENGTHHYANKFGKDENIWLEDGNLHLQAKPYEGDGNFSTTSAAVSSENKFDFKYGRVDVRAKIPTETGMWPAIWMMPANPDYGWPMAGEIDIMELISNQPNKIWSTLHSGVYQTDYYFNKGGTLTIDQGTYYDDYHVYSMDWEPESIRFYVDDQLVIEINEWQNWIEDPETGEIIEREFPAPFNKNFFLKLNLATGGWSQDVDDTTRYGDRTTMKVDYVRVYQKHGGEQGPHVKH